MKTLRSYLHFFGLGIQERLNDRSSFIGILFFLTMILLVFSQIWLMIDQPALVSRHDTFTPQDLVWYVAINEWFLLSIPPFHFILQRRIHSGKFELSLTSPMNDFFILVVEYAGYLLVNVAFIGFYSLAFTYFLTDYWPFRPLSLALLFLGGFLVGILNLIFLAGIGLISRWVFDLHLFHWIWNKTAFLLGGLFLPVGLYPPSFQYFEAIFPFAKMFSVNASTAIMGNCYGQAINIVSLLMWFCIIALALWGLYRKVVKSIESS